VIVGDVFCLSQLQQFATGFLPEFPAVQISCLLSSHGRALSTYNIAQRQRHYSIEMKKGEKFAAKAICHVPSFFKEEISSRIEKR
jgi:hypothetical protein